MLIAKLLIDLGADLNAATSSEGFEIGENGFEIQKYATPLWVVAEKLKNLDLVKLLLVKGAITPYVRFSEEGQKIIKTAFQQIAQ